MDYLINTPIEYLKGVGAERGNALRMEAEIDKLWDLLNYFPFRYVDRSSYVRIIDLPVHEGQSVQLKGRIIGVREIGTGRGKRLQASFQDESGVIDLVWFKGAKWVKDKLTQVFYSGFTENQHATVVRGTLPILKLHLFKIFLMKKGFKPYTTVQKSLQKKGFIQKELKN